MDNIRNSFINLSDPIVLDSFGGNEFWEPVEAPAGTVVIREGEDSRDFYYVLSGALDVMKALGNEENSHKRLAHLQAGDIFGEGSLMSDAGRAASVVASIHSNLLKLSRENFEKLVKADPQAAVGITLGIVKVQNSRLSHMNHRMVALYNISKLSTQYGGNATQATTAVLAEIKKALEGDHMIFNMEGMVQSQTDGANAEPFQMKIPDFASRLSSPGAPPSMTEEGMVFTAIRGNMGELKAVMASACAEVPDEDDLRFLVSIAELLGHLF